MKKPTAPSMGAIATRRVTRHPNLSPARPAMDGPCRPHPASVRSYAELFRLRSSTFDFPRRIVTESLGDVMQVRRAIERTFRSVRWFERRGHIEDVSGTSAGITLWCDDIGAIGRGAVDRVILAIYGEHRMAIIAPLCRMNGWTACDGTLTLLEVENDARRTRAPEEVQRISWPYEG
ncbi:hypothetical protein [Pendulispora albinea]|uniref:Uncharacterized protein n=1 Tax=Pendulispora albinea TaxID=2741071 RepID=A0ABZ2LQJ8_9BACT